jgi:hypothetical protein
MGAESFEVYSGEQDSGAAFAVLREQALYDFGHAGYTGTIAEKTGFVIYNPPTHVSSREAVAALVDSYSTRPEWADAQFDHIASIYNDKWADAVAIGDDEGFGWYFIGWASA